MNRIDMSKARDLSHLNASRTKPGDHIVNAAVESAFLARETIIEAAFRKEFGNPEEMSEAQKHAAAAQCEMECQIVDGVNHFRLKRIVEGNSRLLVEVVQTVEGDTLNTSFRSEIGDLGLGEE